MSKKRIIDIDPEKINQITEGFSLIEKGIFLELVMMAWSSDSQSAVADNPELIAKQIGAETIDVSLVLDKLTKIKAIKKTSDWLNKTSTIKIVFLQEIIDKFKDQKTKSEQVEGILKDTSNLTAKREKRKVGILSRTQKERSKRAELVYLNPLKVNTVNYNGWIPTINFNSSGQGFVVPDEFIERLSESYPGVNVPVELANIYHWSLKEPDKRKPALKMLEFIEKWVERASYRSLLSEDHLDQIAKEIISLN